MVVFYALKISLSSPGVYGFPYESLQLLAVRPALVLQPVQLVSDVGDLHLQATVGARSPSSLDASSLGILLIGSHLEK